MARLSVELLGILFSDEAPNALLTQERFYDMTSRSLTSLVISGGQTGADQGGLLGARDAGAPTGGTAPKGWRTEDGPAPWLADFGLVEGRSKSYSSRTRANVEAADGTALFGDHLSRGSTLTERCCGELGRHVLRIPFTGKGADAEDAAHKLATWVRRHEISILNIAGNRESGCPGIGEFARRVVYRALVLPANR